MHNILCVFCVELYDTSERTQIFANRKTMTLGDPWYQAERGSGISLPNICTLDITLKIGTSIEAGVWRPESQSGHASKNNLNYSIYKD